MRKPPTGDFLPTTVPRGPVSHCRTQRSLICSSRGSSWEAGGFSSWYWEASWFKMFWSKSLLSLSGRLKKKYCGAIWMNLAEGVDDVVSRTNSTNNFSKKLIPFVWNVEVQIKFSFANLFSIQRTYSICTSNIWTALSGVTHFRMWDPREHDKSRTAFSPSIKLQLHIHGDLFNP